MAPLSAEELRAAKEAFVSGWPGTSKAEVFGLSLLFSLCVSLGE